MSTIIGIDLGTTNSCVAIFRDGRAEVLKNTEGDLTTPSVIGRDEHSDEFIVGKIAAGREEGFAKDTIRAVKRLMGKNYEQVSNEGILEGLNYQVAQGDEGAAWVEVCGKQHPPEEISAAILAYLKQSVEEQLEEEITQAVITVPAYFDETQRQATINAGKIAGLNVRKLINEPAAAALTYALDNSDKNTGTETIAVYDLGGGTFDITIAQTQTDKEASGNYTDLNVLSHEGNNHLGGVDFDNTLVRMFKERFKNEHGVELEDIVSDTAVLAVIESKLRNKAEEAKKALSKRGAYEVMMPTLCVHEGKTLGIGFELTREEFEQATIAFVEQTLESCQKALDAAHIGKNDIDHLFLVGGMVRMPLVQQKVEAFFGRKPRKILNPDEVVAMGAAIAGSMLKDGTLTVRGTETHMTISDVTAKDLGVAVDEERAMSVVIARGSSLPCDEVKKYSTHYDNQTAVEVEIFQGNEDKADMNSRLGSFELQDIPPMPAGEPKIEVHFKLDMDNILSVSAKEISSGKSKDIKITIAQGKLSDSTITSLKKTLKVKE